MGDNKAAAKELAERHLKAVGAWQDAVMAEKVAQEALVEARLKLQSALSQMQASQQSFAQATGSNIPVIGGNVGIEPGQFDIVQAAFKPGGAVASAIQNRYGNGPRP